MTRGFLASDFAAHMRRTGALPKVWLLQACDWEKVRAAGSAPIPIQTLKPGADVFFYMGVAVTRVPPDMALTALVAATSLRFKTEF